jgi:hypothetical protein
VDGDTEPTDRIEIKRVKYYASRQRYLRQDHKNKCGNRRRLEIGVKLDTSHPLSSSFASTELRE